MKKMLLPAFAKTAKFMLLFIFFYSMPSFGSATHEPLRVSGITAQENGLKAEYHPETLEIKVFVTEAQLNEGMTLELYDAGQSLVYEKGVSDIKSATILTIDAKEFASGQYTLKLVGGKRSFSATVTISR